MGNSSATRATDLSSLSIPNFPESLKHCSAKHLDLFHHMQTLISHNLTTKPKHNVLKCLESLEVCQNPGHLQSLSGSKVLTPFKNHTQATQSLASAVHATMWGCLPCALPWKGAGKESGNNALRYHS